MAVAHTKDLVKAFQQILIAQGLPHLRDEVGIALTSRQRPARAYVEFARSALTNDYVDAADPHHPLVLAPFGLDTTTAEAMTVRVGFRLAFEAPVRQYQLQHAQLTFVRGDQTLRLMLRAEWDHRTGDHAQPHWHMHSPYAAGSDATDPIDTLWAKRQEMLHLAMCAQWYKSEREQTDRAHSGKAGNATDALHWLESVLTYVRSQLSYATRKEPHIDATRPGIQHV